MYNYIKQIIHQYLCKHSDRVTIFIVQKEFHCVTMKTFCGDCKKLVPQFADSITSNQLKALQLLNK